MSSEQERVSAWLAGVDKRLKDGFLSSDPNIAFASIDDVPLLTQALRLALEGLDYYEALSVDKETRAGNIKKKIADLLSGVGEEETK